MQVGIRWLSFLDLRAADIGESIATARRIQNNDIYSWTKEWLATAKRLQALAESLKLRKILSLPKFKLFVDFPTRNFDKKTMWKPTLFLVLLCLLPVCSQASYNMSVSDSGKFVWFRCAKVGTRTINSILMNQTVGLQNYSRVPFDPQIYKKYFKFAFVRNPWDRVVSCYFNKVVTQSHPPFAICYERTFEEFVYFINGINLAKADIHIRLQTELIPLDQVDFIGRMEQFSKDLGYVLKKLGIRYPVTLKKRNSSSHEHYSKYYNNITKKIIADKYKADIKAFGYQFEYEGS